MAGETPKYRALLSPKFWADAREFSAEAKAVGAFLITGPLGNRIGLFRLSIPGAADEMNLKVEKFRTAFAQIARAFEWQHDSESRVLWIRTWFKYQKITNAKHFQGILKDLSAVPDNPFLALWIKSAYEHIPEWTGGEKPQNLHAVLKKIAGKRCESLCGSQLELPMPEQGGGEEKPATGKEEPFSADVEALFAEGQPIFKGLGHLLAKDGRGRKAEKTALRLLLKDETPETIRKALEFLKGDVVKSPKANGWLGWGKACGNFRKLEKKWGEIRPRSTALSALPSANEEFEWK